MRRSIRPTHSGLTLALWFLLTATGAGASENTIAYSYQVWDGLGYGEPLVVRTPIVATAMPESQFGAIFEPARPVQMTAVRVGEINLAVSCGFAPRSEYLPSGTYRLTIDASRARCPGRVSDDQLEPVANMILQCAVKVANAQRAHYADGHAPQFILHLYWGEEDPRNREVTFP